MGGGVAPPAVPATVAAAAPTAAPAAAGPMPGMVPEPLVPVGVAGGGGMVLGGAGGVEAGGGALDGVPPAVAAMTSTVTVASVETSLPSSTVNVNASVPSNPGAGTY